MGPARVRSRAARMVAISVAFRLDWPISIRVPLMIRTIWRRKPSPVRRIDQQSGSVGCGAQSARCRVRTAPRPWVASRSREPDRSKLEKSWVPTSVARAGIISAGSNPPGRWAVYSRVEGSCTGAVQKS